MYNSLPSLIAEGEVLMYDTLPFLTAVGYKATHVTLMYDGLPSAIPKGAEIQSTEKYFIPL